MSATDKIDSVHLNRWVKDRICAQGQNYLEELATVLLPTDEEGKNVINTIFADHSGDLKTCFTKFFNEWSQREVESTWQKLIDALKNTKKRELAVVIENMLLPSQPQWKDESMEEENKGIVWL